MEIKPGKLEKWLLGIWLIVCPLLVQSQVKSNDLLGNVYTIKEGKMYIILDKKSTAAELEAFIYKFNLSDLKLDKFLKSNVFDSLRVKGWKLELSNDAMVIISKPLLGAKDLGDPAKKIAYTEKQGSIAQQFPRESETVVYGVNRFKSKFPFRVQESQVTFFMKDNLQARKVILAGSFNNWDPTVLAMTKTDSGWMVKVSLLPGKYWYKFITDGNWTIDSDNLIREDDGFGNINSVYYQPNHAFRLEGFTNAKKVYLSGSFNNWREKELLMNKTISGWSLPVYLAQGTHTYKFIVDGTWHYDAKNPDKLPDGQGNYNSTLSLGKPHLFTLKGYKSASKVILTGTFNQWREDELQMKKTSAGWELSYILRPGNYEYKFIVDGNWITDPGNPLLVDNEAGSKNSYLVINPNYTFRLKGYPNAKTVYVAGDFNNWMPNSLPMKRNGEEWTFSVHLSPGKHKYKFLVDGNWILDPGNKLWEENEHGTGNSVVWKDEEKQY